MSGYCTQCGETRRGARFCPDCGAEHPQEASAGSRPPAATTTAPVATPRRTLRCVECAAPIDAGLVCARCASKAVTSKQPQPAVPAAVVSPPSVIQSSPTPDPAPTSVDWTGYEGTSDSPSLGSFLYSFLAAVSLIVLIYCLPNAAGLAFLLAGVAVAVAAVVALVVAAIWGRAPAQNAFYILVALGFGALIWSRLFGKPALGVTYENQGDYALVSSLDPDGSLANAGIEAPVWISSIDGTRVGEGRAELADLIAKKRVFDKCRVRYWNGQTLPTTVEVVVLD